MSLIVLDKNTPIFSGEFLSPAIFSLIDSGGVRVSLTVGALTAWYWQWSVDGSSWVGLASGAGSDTRELSVSGTGRLRLTIASTDPAETVRRVTVSACDAPSTASGGSSAQFVSTTTAFGDSLSAELVPRFQISFSNGINLRRIILTPVGTGTVTWSIPFAVMAVAASGSPAAATASIQTREIVTYRPGTGVVCRFTFKLASVTVGAEVLVGLGNSTNGYFFGINPANASFGICRRSNSVDTWIAAASFNGDTLDGNGPSGMSINTANGNVFQIDFTWLGFGQIRFFVENPSTGQWILCHTIKYANSSTNTSCLVPSFRFIGSVTRSALVAGSGTATLSIPSLAAFYQGITDHGVASSFFNELSSLPSANTYGNVIGLRVDSTFNGQPVLGYIKITNISFANGANRAYRCGIVREPNWSVAPTWVQYDAATSIVSTTTSVITGTPTGGISWVTWSAASTSGSTIYADVFDNEIELGPGETLSVFALTTAGSTGAVAAAISWSEFI